MKRRIPALTAAGILTLSGCGGGDEGSSGSTMSYDFVPPALNATRSYAETIIDNSNNVINVGFDVTATAVNPDGSYAELTEDPSQNTVIVNGTNYAIVTQAGEFNSSGQETSLSYTAPDGSLVMCSYEPHGDGPNFPIAVGAAWTLTYDYACGPQTAVSYSQNGTVVDLESVSVPGGTFSALKLQSTVSWTDQLGASRTQSITNWRDVVTMVSVKQQITIAYSGTLPANGYPVSRQILLQSAP
jgi:hypothetical protein